MEKKIGKEFMHKTQPLFLEPSPQNLGTAPAASGGSLCK